MPAAVVWPGVIKPGLVVDTFVSTMDIFPTVIAAARIDLGPRHTIDGKDMGPILRGMSRRKKLKASCRSREWLRCVNHGFAPVFLVVVHRRDEIEPA